MNPLVLSLFLTATADAGSCDALAAKAATVKGEQVAPAFQALIQCDPKLAEQRFADFMRASADVGSLVSLSLVAIDAQLYPPVWNMMEKVPDIGARDEVAKGVGSHCVDHAGVLPFLQGGYSALGDRQFNSWREALGTCEAPALVTWLDATVAAPPARSYDEKYNAVADALVKRKRAEAMPTLEKAAIAAGATGPFNTVLDRMTDAVRPAEFGGKVSPEDQQKLEAALSNVAAKSGPEQARLVADRLYQNGAEVAAAALLPRIYPDRVQGGGKMLYGVAAVETCEKDAVVHFATVTESAKRWSIVGDVTPIAAAAFKPRLKCAVTSPWQVLVTPEPVKSKADVEAWANGLVTEWAGKGSAAEGREEKGLDLP